MTAEQRAQELVLREPQEHEQWVQLLQPQAAVQALLWLHSPCELAPAQVPWVTLLCQRT